jgi:hypothetical protein
MSKESLLASSDGIKRISSRAISLSVALFTLVVMIFIGLRLWKITSFSLWGGEAFTMIGIKQDWNGMFSYVIADIVHPPLFYILLKLWIALGGNSLLWLKLFPVLSGLALVVPFYFLCRELNFHRPEMSLALFLAAVNGYLILYSQELRMYSLFTFLSMCSFWLFMRYFNSTAGTNGKLVVLTVVNLLNIYTHYYGWLVVGMEFLFLIIWQRHKLLKFGISSVILLLIFAPWAYLVIRHAQSIGGLAHNLDWIPKPHLIEILNFYSTLDGPLGARYLKFVGIALFGLPVLFWLWSIVGSDFRSRRSELISFSWLVLLSFLPVILVFLISQRTAQAVWIDRYFSFMAIPYLILISAAAIRLKPAGIRNIWVVLIVLWGLTAGVNDLKTNRMAWASPQVGSRVRWDDLARQLIVAENDSPGPINIYTLSVISKGLRTGDYASSTSLDYFLDAYGEHRFQFVYARDVKALLNQSPQEAHFWIAYFDLSESPQPSPGRILQESGYRIGDPIVFRQLYNRVVLLPVWRQ